jgi:monofunctional biosynthetic peptidoglycan transglycosylase
MIYSFLKNKTFWTFIVVATATLLVWLTPPVWHLKFSYTTVTQWHRQGGAKQVDVGPAKPGWIESSAVSKNILYAFVVAEDGRFYVHNGFDLTEIWESLRKNINKGRYARGGSTISQQVVKMAFLSREKTLTRKLREALGTVVIELLLSKDDILEWYINLAEFGDGIYGLRAASQHYFQTKPELLTIQQATNLAVVLPSPNGWSVGLRRRNLTEFGQRRYATIATQMKLAGYITPQQWVNALATGNFGRPVRAYERLRQREPVSKEDVQQSSTSTDTSQEPDESILREEDATLESEEEEP